MFNESDYLLLPADYEYFISIAVHNHILNSIMTVFIIAFVVGHGFGMFNREILEYVKLRLKGHK